MITGLINNKMGLFKISCDDATVICDKSQYKESTLLEKLTLMIHFISCKMCRLYTKRNNFLTALVNSNKESLCNEPKKGFNEKEKENLKKNLENYTL